MFKDCHFNFLHNPTIYVTTNSKKRTKIRFKISEIVIARAEPTTKMIASEIRKNKIHILN